MKKILIIEDNPVNMKLFADLLTAKGYDIAKEYDGEAGYNAILANKFDLLILDIQLPKLNGFELLERIKNQNIEMPKTIIVSAFAMENEINTAKMYGVESYITKPIDVIKFINTVDEIVKKEE